MGSLGTHAMIARHAIRPMRGGSQSHLLLCEQATLCVVKFQNNPQHRRTLVNELLVTRIGESIGLSVPQGHIVHVPAQLIAGTPSLTIHRGPRQRESCLPGEHFGSQYAGGLLPGFVLDSLPDGKLDAVTNLAEFAGMLAVDKWTGNCDRRQAVFQRTPRRKNYRAWFIDHGLCFNGGAWTFPDAPTAGVYAHRRVYNQVNGWNSFEPWLSRIESFPAESLWQIVTGLPADWHTGSLSAQSPFALEQLIDTLLRRRSQVRDLIHALHLSDPTLFPHWCPTPSTNVLL